MTNDARAVSDGKSLRHHAPMTGIGAMLDPEASKPPSVARKRHPLPQFDTFAFGAGTYITAAEGVLNTPNDHQGRHVGRPRGSRVSSWLAAQVRCGGIGGAVQQLNRPQRLIFPQCGHFEISRETADLYARGRTGADEA
jgi:hypothetical protein